MQIFSLGKPRGFRYFSYVLKKLFCLLLEQNFTVKLSFVLSLCFMLTNIYINISIPFCLKNIISKIEIQISDNRMIFHICIYGILWILANFTLAIRDMCILFFSEIVSTNLNHKFLSHINKLPISFYINNTKGDLVSTLQRGQDSLSVILYDLFFMLVPTIIEICISIIIIVFFYGKKYGLTVLIIVIAFLTYNIFMSRRIVYSRSDSNYYHKKVVSMFLEIISNFEVIKYFNNQDIEIKNHKTLLDQKSKIEINNIFLLGISQIGHSVILGTGLLILSITLYKEIANGERGISDFVLINTLFLKFLIPLSNFGAILRRSNIALQDIMNFFQIMDIPTNSQTEKILSLEKNTKNKIEFQNVAFNYTDKKEVLKDVSFTIESGKITSLVGLTGSGKSTITKLLFGMYENYSGNILINGSNIKNIKQEAICDLIGFVPQKPDLFNNTLAYNIKYGKLSATQEEIVYISKLVGLDDYVNSLPNKYDTMIGENGIKLSGGERQKISIARALLKNPEIYIFDEINSFLDANSNKIILSLIKNKLKDKCILIISHDLFLVSQSDEILFLSDCKILERGGHDSLLKRKSFYWDFWHKQNFS
jgi:ABC-type transport system involved in Fe-S cluster assembly fused permease/ATPase subunit